MVVDRSLDRGRVVLHDLPKAAGRLTEDRWSRRKLVAYLCRGISPDVPSWSNSHPTELPWNEDLVESEVELSAELIYKSRDPICWMLP